MHNDRVRTTTIAEPVAAGRAGRNAASSPLRPELGASTSSKVRYAGVGSLTVAQGRAEMPMLLYFSAVPDERLARALAGTPTAKSANPSPLKSRGRSAWFVPVR
jgi:hypothetical protein